MRYPITPIPYPKITYKSRFSPRAKRYWAWCDHIRNLGVNLPNSGAYITFLIPMPKSWSKKKKEAMNMTPHQQTPDIKNLLWAIEDALRKDDKNIWHYSGLEKTWSYEGAIEIVITK